MNLIIQSAGGARRRAGGSWGHQPAARAFTMIEIAISLAVIGFALVAIIGILPTGMSVQKENREETIINQDASVWLNAIRNGERGLDDLTNYVVAITNTVVPYSANGAPGAPVRTWYTYGASSVTPVYGLTNGARIVGLLSTPKYIPLVTPTGASAGFLSNHVVAVVRAMSGMASEKYPQRNPSLQDLAFTYRLIPDIVPYTPMDPWSGGRPGSADGAAYTNFWAVATNLTVNLRDLRLTFRYPQTPDGKVGNGRQVFRTMVSGEIIAVSEPGFETISNYFFQPRTYTKAP